MINEIDYPNLARAAEMVFLLTLNELVKINNVSTSASVCELMGAVAFGSRLKRENGSLRLITVTENPKIARRIFQLMKDALGIVSKVKINKSIRGNVYYSVYTEDKEAVSLMILEMLMGRLSMICSPQAGSSNISSP